MSFGRYGRLDMPTGFVTGSPGVLPSANMLVPYSGFYGEAESTGAEAEAPQTTFLDTLAAYAPAVSELTSQFTDPHKQAATLRAKLQTAQLRGASPARIAMLQAKLEAAERQAGLRSEQERQGRSRRDLTNILIYSGVAVGGALAFLLVVQAVKAAKATKKR